MSMANLRSTSPQKGNTAMTPLVILGLAVLAVLATTILALAFSTPPRKRPGFGIDGKFEPFDDTPGPDPVHGLDVPRPGWRPKPNISFDKIKRELPTREQRVFGKRTIAPYRKPYVAMTPRMLEHVNIQS